MTNDISLEAVHTSNFIKINEGKKAFDFDTIKDRLLLCKKYIEK